MARRGGGAQRKRLSANTFPPFFSAHSGKGNVVHVVKRPVFPAHGGDRDTIAGAAAGVAIRRGIGQPPAVPEKIRRRSFGCRSPGRWAPPCTPEGHPPPCGPRGNTRPSLGRTHTGSRWGAAPLPLAGGEVDDLSAPCAGMFRPARRHRMETAPGFTSRTVSRSSSKRMKLFTETGKHIVPENGPLSRP